MGTIAKNRTNLEAPVEYVALPLVYALLPSKETVLYSYVLETVLSAASELRIQNFMPLRIMGDFEFAIINACRQIFPEALYSGCFFHFTQNIYRKVQEKGLQTEYADIENREIKKYSHMLMALAFVPIVDVQEVFLELEELIPENLEPVSEYVKETYYVIGRPGRGRRRAVPPIWYPVRTNTQELSKANTEQTTVVKVDTISLG